MSTRILYPDEIQEPVADPAGVVLELRARGLELWALGDGLVVVGEVSEELRDWLRTRVTVLVELLGGEQ